MDAKNRLRSLTGDRDEPARCSRRGDSVRPQSGSIQPPLITTEDWVVVRALAKEGLSVAGNRHRTVVDLTDLDGVAVLMKDSKPLARLYSPTPSRLRSGRDGSGRRSEPGNARPSRRGQKRRKRFSTVSWPNTTFLGPPRADNPPPRGHLRNRMSVLGVAGKSETDGCSRVLSEPIHAGNSTAMADLSSAAQRST
jgi:hypothetical protein